ncbi:flagellar biosynthesis protein FlhF [Peribacillus tepidiphilus]|uniref:flagellar biosynthesis protein FlhF n=1 Tax=Peribacillus tepidiphilus TaxID=2652445 RepID=UPI0035B55B6C
MKVKKYVAPSMSEAMKKIRTELGSDAVILNSKVVYSGGFLGLFKKRSIEVIAGVDASVNELQSPVLKEKPKRKKETPPSNDSTKGVSQSIKTYQVSTVPSEENGLKLLTEISELKQIVKDIHVKAGKATVYPKPILEIEEMLREQEINESAILSFMEELLSVYEKNEGTRSKEELINYVKSKMTQQLIDLTEQKYAFQKKFINVVGPTGVGKTTTLAKLAAENVIKHNKNVAFITTDTYRIAAIDQLQTYAKILNVPIEVAYNLEDFKKAAEKFNHYDLIFIDTAGRNFRNQEYVKDLMKLIDFDNDMETYLVLSLTAKQKDMEAIYNQFSIIPIHQVIFTKMDETSSFGAMYNMITNYQLSAAYITNGQNVPDDIIKASPEFITQSIFGVENHEGSS